MTESIAERAEARGLRMTGQRRTAADGTITVSGRAVETMRGTLVLPEQRP